MIFRTEEKFTTLIADYEQCITKEKSKIKLLKRIDASSEIIEERKYILSIYKRNLKETKREFEDFKK